MLLANKEGIVVNGPIVALAGFGVGNSVVIFTIPILAGQLVGTKSVKILAVHMFNNVAGNQLVTLGQGIAGVGIPALMPGLQSMNNLPDIYIAGVNLPEDVEAFANITAWPAAALGGGTIDIQLIVAVIG